MLGTRANGLNTAAKGLLVCNYLMVIVVRWKREEDSSWLQFLLFPFVQERLGMQRKFNACVMNSDNKAWAIIKCFVMFLIYICLAIIWLFVQSMTFKGSEKLDRFALLWWFLGKYELTYNWVDGFWTSVKIRTLRCPELIQPLTSIKVDVDRSNKGAGCFLDKHPSPLEIHNDLGIYLVL